MAQTVKNLPAMQAVLWFYPWAGKIPWSGDGSRYPCLGNPMDRGARRAAVHGVPAVGYGRTKASLLRR